MERGGGSGVQATMDESGTDAAQNPTETQTQTQAQTETQTQTQTETQTPAQALAALLHPARSIEGLDVPVTLVQDIVLRQALFDGRTSTVELCEKLHVGPSVMTMIIEELRELRYLEVQGLESRNYKLALTEVGREQTNDRLQMCRYAGAVPVSLAVYCAVVRAQHATPSIDMASLRAAFSDLVVADELLEELGPATLAGGAMFLYGPPGTGKSSIAERLLRVHTDAVAIPYAVEVDGQVITVFDPIQHKPVAVQPDSLDRRWVLCERPSIIVGGELTGRMLDLAYEPGSGVYLAPLQMQANNGILVIDDFGRQTLTPEQLLNRWIVPLDRQVDYLSLNYGVKFAVPFDPKIVFSTNLEPEVLGDEAFFRRIQSKILIPTIDDDQFDEVLRRVCIAQSIPIAPGAPTYLRHISRTFGDGDLRPYLPAAMVKILQSMSAFRKCAPVLDRATIDRAARVYFTHARKLNGVGAAAAPAHRPALAPVPVLDGGPQLTARGWLVADR